MELLNPPKDPNVAESSVIDENKIGVELSDRQNKILRRGVGSKRPQSETLDKMSGKFIITENAEKWAKLRQRIARLRTAKPIIQETGEGIDFIRRSPKGPTKGRTYGWHKVPMHPSNAILIRPNKPAEQMDMIKHFRKIQNTKDFAPQVHGSVQQFLPLRHLRNNVMHMSGQPFKRHATISRAQGKSFKKGDIVMRRVGGKPEEGKYGTVGDTFYIEQDSPKGEMYTAKVRLAATYGKGQSWLVSPDVINAFKNREPFRLHQKQKGRNAEYAFQTDGDTLFQLSKKEKGLPQKRYEIASWDDEGDNLNWSFEGRDSASTIQAGKMLGLDIERKEGKMFVNGEYMDHLTKGKPMKISRANLKGEYKSKTRSKITPKQYEDTKAQTRFRQRSESYWKKQKGVLGEQYTDPETGEIFDQASIQPHQQRQINKTLGFPEEHNVGEKIIGDEYDHPIPARTIKKMGGSRDIGTGTPLSHKTHTEREDPASTIPKAFRRRIQKARLKIARIRQRNISRINIAQKSVMNLRETRVSDIRRIWNEQAANRKKSPKGFTILDGDVLDLNYPAHTQKILDKYPGKGNVYIVSNLKGVTDIDSPEVDIGFDKWKKLNYTPQAGGFEGGVEMNALFRAEDNEQAKAFTSDFEQDSYTEVRPDGTFGFYDRDGNEKHYD